MKFSKKIFSIKQFIGFLQMPPLYFTLEVVLRDNDVSYDAIRPDSRLDEIKSDLWDTKGAQNHVLHQPDTAGFSFTRDVVQLNSLRRFLFFIFAMRVVFVLLNFITGIHKLISYTKSCELH